MNINNRFYVTDLKSVVKMFGEDMLVCLEAWSVCVHLMMKVVVGWCVQLFSATPQYISVRLWMWMFTLENLYLCYTVLHTKSFYLVLVWRIAIRKQKCDSVFQISLISYRVSDNRCRMCSTRLVTLLEVFELMDWIFIIYIQHTHTCTYTTSVWLWPKE